MYGQRFEQDDSRRDHVDFPPLPGRSAFPMLERSEKRVRDIINFLHDPLACAIALGLTDGGVEIREMWLKSEIKDGRLYQTVDQTAKPASVVTRVNGTEFSKFWLRTVTQN